MKSDLASVNEKRKERRGKIVVWIALKRRKKKIMFDCWRTGREEKRNERWKSVSTSCCWDLKRSFGDYFRESEMKVLVAWCSSSIQQFESVKEKKERKSGLSMWSGRWCMCNVTKFKSNQIINYSYFTLLTNNFTTTTTLTA